MVILSMGHTAFRRVSVYRATVEIFPIGQAILPAEVNSHCAEFNGNIALFSTSNLTYFN